MQRLFALIIAALACAATANADALDPARIAAIDQAAKDFALKAAAARKTGSVPRQNDPAVGPLLDAVFDTGELGRDATPYADIDKLEHWLKQVAAVGAVYNKAAAEIRDFGIFAPELGRYLDAVVGVTRAMAQSMTAELLATPPVRTPSPGDLRKLAAARDEATANLARIIGRLHLPGVTGAWMRQRLDALDAAAPAMARFLTPAQLARLRAAALGQAAAIREKAVHAAFTGLAIALAAPPPPPRVAVGAAEIALESDGQGYTVPVHINGAPAARFVVDTGAGVVALPADLVEALTKSGTIAPGDLLGPGVYVAADGKRHRGNRLMLREVEVGGHIAVDVMATVLPARASPLLGLSFLGKFRSWTLDNKRRVLVINE